MSSAPLADLWDRAARPSGARPLRVVAVSWRDLAHPSAGGAEVMINRVLSGLHARGHTVALVCGGPVADHPFEVLDAGGTYSQYLRAPAICRRRFRDADVLIDVQNGLPYFSPLWHRCPSVCLVHHVHIDQWATRFPRPIAAVLRGVERRVMPAVYRNTRYVAVSRSTALSLEAIGAAPGSITVIESGVDAPQGRSSARSAEPLLLSLNRLVPHKRVDLLLDAWALAHTRIPGRLVIAGDGPLLDDLRRKASAIPRVDVLGRVTEAEKEDLLARAWLILSAAHHEGWGMSVLEAAAFGTPTLAVDAPGIRDAVQDGVTGRLVVGKTDADLPSALGGAMVQLVGDGAQRERYGTAARRRADDLSWNHSLDHWEWLLQEVACSSTAEDSLSHGSQGTAAGRGGRSASRPSTRRAS